MKKMTCLVPLSSKLAAWIVTPLALFVLSGCASEKKYDKMRTMEEATDSENVKDGMALTKKGAVVDIQVEEVQAQKRRLVEQLAERDKKIDYLDSRLKELESKYGRLREHAGLPFDEAKRKVIGYNADGSAKMGDTPPTLSDELKDLKHRKETKAQE